MTTPAVRPSALTDAQRRLLERLTDEQAPQSQRAIPRLADRSHAPLSSAQQRVWFFDRLEPGSPLYVISGVARFTGSLDVAVLRRCLDEITRRHEVLRTTFHGDDEPWSTAREPAGVPLRYVDLTSRPTSDRAAAARRELDVAARRPFDLSRDLMLRGTLVRVAPDEHLLQLSMHHIAADGWSLGILLRELGALYPALAGDRPSPLPELPAQYADYAAWQRGQLAEPAYAARLRYWQEHLAGASALDLPTDRPRSSARSFAGGRVPLDVPADLVRAVEALAKSRQATTYMVLHAALTAVLARWSGQSDVVLGCAIAGRDRLDIEPLVGFFVNTLALRTSLGDDPSFETLVDRVKAVCLDGFARQDVPFEEVVGALRPDRDPGARVPLVRHLLVLHNAPRPSVRLPGVVMDVVPLDTGTAKFDLQVELTPAGDGRLTGSLEYARDLYDETTARQLADGWLHLLGAAAQRPETVVGDLDMLSDADRVLVTERWSRAGGAALGAGTLHQLVERSVDRQPDAPAVTDGETTLSYAELDGWANRLAHRVRALGVGPEDVVGIALPRSVAALAAMLGVLKAGAAYLPLDPDHPPARLERMLTDAAARVVLTTGTAPAWDGASRPWLALDVDDPSVMTSPAGRPEVAVGADNAAYVIYTSGSTGTPKGAVNEHRAVVNRILWMQAAYRLDAAESVLHKTPLGFDVAGWEWLWPLAVGARVVVAGHDAHRDPAAIVRLVTEQAVSTCHFVPSMLRSFLEEPTVTRCAGVLRRVVCSGEELTPPLAARLHDVLPDVELHNLYGPTEAAIDVTAWPVPSRWPDDDARLPIGFPIAGARLYVVDDRLQPVPPGAPGELLIGGAPVCRGYVGKPGLTADRFVPEPFARGRRVYRTGDRARWLADGALEFLGRLDHQAKIRGQRVEPAEVEAVLATHPAVDAAVVQTYRDAAGDTQLAAYATLRAPADDPAMAPDPHGSSAVFDRTWRHGAPSAGSTLAGWVDSATGEPIPEREIVAWAEETVARVTSSPPGRLLDIGCGTGPLGLRLAPCCERYVGTDISAEAIAVMTSRLRRLPAPCAAQVQQRAADDFSGWPPASFDTVVLSSVTQYFPDVDYLVRVVRGALSVLAPGGRLFVGGVRSLPLLEAHHCSILLHRLPDDTPTTTLRRALAQEVAREEELAIHPSVFREIAGPDAAVTLLAKSSSYRNETTRFRYDVVITPGVPVPEDVVDWTPWPVDVLPRPSAGGRAVGIIGVPDARVAADLLALRLVHDPSDPAGGTVGALRRAVLDQAAEGAEPSTFAGRGHDVVPHLGAEPGLLDVELRPPGAPASRHEAVTAPAGSRDGWSAYANAPREATRRRLVVAGLREHVSRSLPAHMVPATFTVVADWPLSANGKLDRAALPPPDVVRPLVENGYVAPRTDTERTVAAVWCDVLGIDRVGAHDDFFALGGHSLMALHLATRLRERFHREIPLGPLLRAPTVAALAAMLDETPAADGDVAPIDRVARLPRRVAGQQRSGR